MIGNDEKVAELFAAAINYEPDERRAFLASECDGEPLLLAEVEALLAADEEVVAAGFMCEPALKLQASQYARELEASRLGERIGHYEILSLIGEGGMGEVYLARDLEFERKVALKLIKGGLQTKAIRRRFLGERQILASLDHPNIARLLDGGTTDDGLPYFVMEYVEGQPIDAYADAHGLSTGARLKLFRMVCAGVQYAHQNLVIHRDIKPSNILVTEAGTPKLLDFGIAKLFDPTRAGEAPEATATLLRVMTPEYASPEQVKGAPITTASDVYSLGVLLYELLTGRRPYRFKSRQTGDAASAICEAEPERPSHAVSRAREAAGDDQTPGVDTMQLRRQLRGDLDNIILMALRKEPPRRYSSVSEFSEDINRHLDGLPVRARKDTFNYRASKFVRRNRVAVAAAVVVLLILIAGIVATAWEARRANRRFNDVRKMAHSMIFELNDAIMRGPTKARQLLVTSALEYLDSLAREARSDASLQHELADAYMQIGDIQGRAGRPNLGDAAGALTNYQKAAALLESLRAAAPQDRAVQMDLSLAYEGIGKLQMRSDDCAAAIETHRRALALRQALSAAEPANAEYRSLVGASFMRIGDSFETMANHSSDMNDYLLTLENYRQALNIFAEQSAQQPGDSNYQEWLATLHQRLGTGLECVGDRTGDAEQYRLALGQHRQSLAGWQTLSAAAPDNSGLRVQTADEFAWVGTLQTKLGEPAGALENINAAQSIYEALAASDAANVELRYGLTFIYRQKAQVLARAGDTDQAIGLQQQALSLYDELLKANPSRTESYSTMAASYRDLATWLEGKGDIQGAIEMRRKEIEIDDKLLAATANKVGLDRVQADAQARLGKLYTVLAAAARNATQRRADYHEALSAYQRSLALWHEGQNQDTLSQADIARADEVSRDLAICQAALLTSNKRSHSVARSH
jgi:eukaryotic-like serine/threonine-protein kinase